MNGLSMHWYSLASGDWKSKGSALDFGEDQWHSLLRQTLRMEELIAEHGRIMDKYDPEKRIGMVVDEWGTWYDVEPGTDPGFLYQQNTLRDAIAAGISLNIFNRHCDRVTMANISQMVNVLQAIILTDKEKMILTPTYEVFQMYKVHQQARLIPVEVSAPQYKLGDQSIRSLSASASLDSDRRLHVSIVNLDPNRPAQASVKCFGMKPKAVTGSVLTADAINAHNTFQRPDAVKSAQFSAFEIGDDALTVQLPSKSVGVLEIHTLGE
jgi:alpha-N-arabinofuranosidase